MNNVLYTELTREIETAKSEGKTSVMISNSETLSADQIHTWFPDMEVKWDTENHIHIRWA
jgi:aspartyl aminopeptidase